MRIYWFYYRSILLINIGISFLLSAFGFEMNPSMLTFNFDTGIIPRFLLVFAVLGFLLSVLLDSYFYKKRKFLYYNLGYSKKKVIAGALLINLVIAVPALLITELWK